MEIIRDPRSATHIILKRLLLCRCQHQHLTFLATRRHQGP